MKAVQVAACLLELLYPFLGLCGKAISAKSLPRHRHTQVAHLGNHHVAVKRASAMSLGRLIDMLPDRGHDGCPKGDVGNEVPVPVSSG